MKSYRLSPSKLVENGSPNLLRRNILIVDDQPANRRLISQMLATIGYIIAEAEDGSEAVESLRVLLPDLIIMDLEMPRMGGLEAIRAIRKMDGPVTFTPILAATGNPQPETQANVIQAGADAYLTKPFNLQDLTRAIAELLQEQQQQKTEPEDSAESSPESGPVENAA